MSIDSQIQVLVGKGELFPLQPADPREAIKRPLLMSKSMNTAVVVGPWSDHDEEMRLAAVLRADLERFLLGGFLRASLTPKSSGEDIKRLQDATEVWEIKSETKHGIRVFGRFAAKDVFVATHWHWRKALGPLGSRQWQAEINRCLRDWRRLLPNHNPHTGTQIDDYLSNAKDVSVYK